MLRALGPRAARSRAVGPIFWLTVALVVGLAGAASAHPLAPSSLTLVEGEGGVVVATWRTPAVGPVGVRLAPRFPMRCAALEAPAQRHDAESQAHVGTVRLACGEAGLDGAVVSVAGIEGAPTNVIVHVTRADGRSASGLIDAGRPSFTIPARQGAVDVLVAYGELGVWHLVFGLDHVLFVLGLLVLVRGARLVVAVTAFTVGHSVTLALAVLDVVSLPSGPVEIAIAASLVAVAVEVVRRCDGHGDGPISRRPWLLSGAFGLVHGLGFAGALGEVGLPDEAVPLALLGFNVGVEVGQLAVVTLALGLGAVAARASGGRLTGAREGVGGVVAAYVVGGLGAFWVLQRALGELASLG